MNLGPMLSVFGNISMFVGGMAITVWVVKSMRNGRTDHAEAVAGWAELLKQLQTVGNSMVLVEERLKNLPTRAEVMGNLRAHIRHDIGDKVQPIQTELENVDRSVVDLTAELRRKRR